MADLGRWPKNMRSILISLSLLAFFVGCSTPSKKAFRGDVDVTFNDIGFPSCGGYENPYTSKDIGLANRYIEERLEFYGVHHYMVAYLVPTTDSNRLVFITTRLGYKPSEDLYEKISKDVDQFLTSRIAIRK